VDGATVSRTSFESDLGGWAVGGPPPGSPDSPVNGMRSRRRTTLYLCNPLIVFDVLPPGPVR